jgi:hypothetical protein
VLDCWLSVKMSDLIIGVEMT